MDAPENALSCNAFPYREQSAVFSIGGWNFFRLTEGILVKPSYRSSRTETSVLDNARYNATSAYNGIIYVRSQSQSNFPLC